MVVVVVEYFGFVLYEFDCVGEGLFGKEGVVVVYYCCFIILCYCW